MPLKIPAKSFARVGVFRARRPHPPTKVCRTVANQARILFLM